MTAAEELELISDAIRDILTVGQSVSAGGKSWSKADLPTLYARQRELEAKVARVNRGGGMRVSQIVPQ